MHCPLQVQQDAELQNLSQQHAQKLAHLQSQQANLEACATAMLQQAQQQLAATSALSEGELSAVKEKAAAAAEVQAMADAAEKKQQVLKEAMQKVDEEVRLPWLQVWQLLLCCWSAGTAGCHLSNQGSEAGGPNDAQFKQQFVVASCDKTGV